MTTFLRSQRRALVALPVLLVLAVAASGQRMVDLWWPQGMNDRVEVDESGTARFSTTLDLQVGRRLQEVAVRHVSTEPVTTVPLSGDESTPVPPGLDAYRVRVRVTASPETVLSTCQVFLRDSQGREYPAGTRVLEGGAPDLGSCQPADIENPSGFTMDSDETSTRPPAFDRDVVFLVPDGVRPAVVRVSPDLHHYADWALPTDS